MKTSEQFVTPATQMSRVVRGGFPDRRFDVDFWQKQGDVAIFEAAWEMVEFSVEFKDTHMESRPGFKRFLRLLNYNQADYIIVGDYAVMKYTEPFYTKGIDIWIDTTSENAVRTYQALVRFGASVADLTVQDLTRQHIVFQFGMVPARVDVMTSIDGVNFGEAWSHRVQTRLEDIPISVLSLPHVKQNKKTADRDIDKVHLAHLEKYGNQPG